MVQGSLGVLGPTRMQYERAMTAVAYVAQLFSEALSKDLNNLRYRRSEESARQGSEDQRAT